MKKKSALFWGKCYLHVTPFCWTDLPLDNPWYKCTWNDLYFILFKCIEEKKKTTKKPQKKKKKTTTTTVCVTRVPVGASRGLSRGFITKSNSLIRLVFLKRRLKIGLLEHRRKTYHSTIATRVYLFYFVWGFFCLFVCLLFFLSFFSSSLFFFLFLFFLRVPIWTFLSGN